MKKICNTVCSMVLLFCCLLFSSCQKFIDRISNHYENKEYCDIVKVTQGLGSGFRTGIVYNNPHGNPDSVIFDERTGSSGSQFFYFKYDNMHRLIEYSGWYGREKEDDYYFISRYGYERDRIVFDTTQWRQAGTWTRMGKIEYDAAGRLIRETSRDTLPDGIIGSSSDGPTLTYIYNNDGNLDGPEYDNKVNFLRTNNVWMFTQRNYSKNNPVGATGYNDHDLPLGFGSTIGVPFLQFNGPAEIEYDCDIN